MPVEGKFDLMTLPYAPEALEPVISAATLGFHHGKHLAAWLAADAQGKLVITQEPNAANPIQRGLRPLMTMDVWEHAYYLDYQNRRPDHLAALWQIIDWDVVAARYEQ